MFIRKKKLKEEIEGLRHRLRRAENVISHLLTNDYCLTVRVGGLEGYKEGSMTLIQLAEIKEQFSDQLGKESPL